MGKAAKKRLYLLEVTGGVQIKLHGPYGSWTAARRVMAEIEARQDVHEDGLFWLEQVSDGRLVAGEFGVRDNRGSDVTPWR